MPEWVQNAREILFRAGISDRGWGYRLGATPAVEPTVLACLALLATDPQPPEERTVKTVRSACGWMARLQLGSGGVALAPGIPQVDWTTSYAILLWATQEGFEPQRRRAAGWLLETKGATFPKRPDDPVGHNTELVGWPWIGGTHSWLEPTAMAVLALRREGLAEHARVQEGLKVIRDRALPDGGWNYGNTSAFGNTLRAQPAPTGQALLALKDVEPESPIIVKASEYLSHRLPETLAPRSLAWGLMGLTAWGRRPEQADAWLAEAYRPLVDRREPPYLLALLLLAAAGDSSLRLLGIAETASHKATS